MSLEEDVRATVRELADDAPAPHDLAAVARTRGRRIRRRRQAGFAALAVALIAVTITPYALLRPEPQPIAPAPAERPTETPTERPTETPTREPAPEPAGDWWNTPYQLPGGAIVTALSHRDVGLEGAPPDKTVHDGNVLLNPETGRYTVLPASYYTIWGAPVGGRAAASNGTGGIGIVDAAGGRGIWLDIAADPVWSSDGTRLLFTTDRGFGIIEAATGDVRYRSTPMELCPDMCRFSWLPGDEEVAVAQRDPAVTQSEDRADTVKDVAVYSAADGSPRRVVPVPGVPVRQDAWSPDGRLVLVDDQETLGGPVHVVEVATGREIGTIDGRDVHFLPDGRILALTDATAQLYDGAARPLEKQTLPEDFRNRELSVGRP